MISIRAQELVVTAESAGDGRMGDWMTCHGEFGPKDAVFRIFQVVNSVVILTPS